jgi:ubiquinone/menaquinone biosynthesis C-methylase UbiE
MNWNKIWKKNEYLTNLYPTNNIIAFYEYHLSSLKKRSKILDCGCGSGRNFKYLVEKNFDIIGTDTSEDIIKKNKKNFNPYKNKFYLGDIRSLNFRENSFDAIISEASLYYQSIKDIKETIDKFYYLLKPNCFLRVYTKSINDNFFKTFKKNKSIEYKIIRKKHWENGLTLSFLTIKDIKIIFKKFTNLKIGIEEFNYVDLNKKHSFFIITAKK